jgi:ketol-acid reductoisomerase
MFDSTSSLSDTAPFTAYKSSLSSVCALNSRRMKNIYVCVVNSICTGEFLQLIAQLSASHVSFHHTKCMSTTNAIIKIDLELLKIILNISIFIYFFFISLV